MKTPWEACVYNELVAEASYDLDRQLKRENLYEWYCGPKRKVPVSGSIVDVKGRVIGTMTPKRRLKP